MIVVGRYRQDRQVDTQSTCFVDEQIFSSFAFHYLDSRKEGTMCTHRIYLYMYTRFIFLPSVRTNTGGGGGGVVIDHTNKQETPATTASTFIYYVLNELAVFSFSFPANIAYCRAIPSSLTQCPTPKHPRHHTATGSPTPVNF